MQPKPDLSFFIVGAPKCGTTALFDYLTQHPQVFEPAHKEPNFFGADLNGDTHYKASAAYAALFAPAAPGQLCGEGSTWYLFSKLAAQEIAQAYPAANIIIMLRQPVELLYSLHSQMVFDGFNEDIVDFEEALAAEPDRAQGRRMPKGVLRPEATLYSEVVKFAEQIARYQAVFPPEQVKLIFYDDFKADTLAVYQQTLGFLGLPADFTPNMQVVNANKVAKSKTMNELLTGDNIVKKTARLLLPEGVRRRLYKTVKQANTEYAQRPPLSAAVYNKLTDRFRPEVEALARLTGRDLSGWLAHR